MTSIERLAEVAGKYGVVVGATTLAAGAGYLVGFYYAKHSLQNKIQEAAEKDIAEQVDAARKYVIIKEEKPETPGDAVEELIPEAAEALRTYKEQKEAEEALEMYQGKESEPHSVEEPVAYHRARLFREEEKSTTVIPAERKNNIWEDRAQRVDDVDFDYAAEVAARSHEVPYIISEEEFNENAGDFRQFKLTYFAKDGILMDHEDDVIHDIDGYIGGVANLRFGHRSGDNRLVYIRNHKYDHDFQVALSDGSYAHEVAGFDEE